MHQRVLGNGRSARAVSLSRAHSPSPVPAVPRRPGPSRRHRFSDRPRPRRTSRADQGQAGKAQARAGIAASRDRPRSAARAIAAPRARTCPKSVAPRTSAGSTSRQARQEPGPWTGTPHWSHSSFAGAAHRSAGIFATSRDSMNRAGWYTPLRGRPTVNEPTMCSSDAPRRRHSVTRGASRSASSRPTDNFGSVRATRASRLALALVSSSPSPSRPSSASCADGTEGEVVHPVHLRGDCRLDWRPGHRRPGTRRSV